MDQFLISSAVTAPNMESADPSQRVVIYTPTGLHSWVWNYAKRYCAVAHPDLQNHFWCPECKGPIAYASKSAGHVDRHLRQHQSILDDYQKKLTEKSVPVNPQKKMSSFTESCPAFFMCYLKWIISEHLPFDMCNKQSFRDMCRSLTQSAPIFDRKRVTDAISDQAAVVKGDLSCIYDKEYFALTCDHWTSCATESYFACTIHAINADWRLIASTLCCKLHVGPQTGVNVAMFLDETRRDYNLDVQKMIAVVTDSAANMNVAGRELPPTCNHHYCIDHVLELTTGLAFASKNRQGLPNDWPDGRECMEACRALVAYLKRSPGALDHLKSHQEARDGFDIVGVIQDVATRWWSTYQMVERLIRLRPAIERMIYHNQLPGEYHLTPEHWSIMINLSVVLKPFMIIQKLLEGQQYVTVSLIPFIISLIREGFESAIADGAGQPVVLALVNDMKEDFTERWGTGNPGTMFLENATRGPQQRQKGIPLLVLLAAALDPRTFSLIGITEEDQVQIWATVSASMKRILDNDPALPAPPVAPPQPHPQRYNPFARLQAGAAPNQAQTIQQRVDEELAAYRREPTLPMDLENYGDPLGWWREHQQLYPTLARLARRILCIPATSAPSERVFSNAGLTIANKRAGLLPQNAAACIFLHDSWPVADEYATAARQRARVVHNIDD